MSSHHETTEMPDPLPVAYLDQHLAILVKPAGVLSVPGRSTEKQDCFHSRVQIELPELRIVHRLDRDTSGVMVMARSPDMQRELARLFELRQVHKEYVAHVHGQMKAEAGEIDEPIACQVGSHARGSHERRVRVDGSLVCPDFVQPISQ